MSWLQAQAFQCHQLRTLALMPGANQGRARSPVRLAGLAGGPDEDLVDGQLPDEGSGGTPPGGAPGPIQTDPAIVAELIERSQACIATLQGNIRTKSGSACSTSSLRTSRS